MAEKSDKDVAPFNDRETKMMASAWTCMSEEPKIDYNKLAEAMGMTNPKSAANAWALIKKKLAAINEKTNGDDANGAATKTPKATPKRKKAATTTAGADADGEEASPTKKPKATPKGRTKKSQAKVEEDPEEVPVKNEENEDGEPQD